MENDMTNQLTINNEVIAIKSVEIARHALAIRKLRGATRGESAFCIRYLRAIAKG